MFVVLNCKALVTPLIKMTLTTRTRGDNDTGNTRQVWVYDLRANMPAFGKRTPLTHQNFIKFEKAYVKKADGTSKRTDQGDGGRFRCFT